MTGNHNKLILAGVLAVVVGLVLWACYATFIQGTNGGPDFISATQAGEIKPESISSIEIIEPTVGHTPFTAAEYDSLPRQATITSAASVDQLLMLFKESLSGRQHQNHPATTYAAYLKVNTGDSFYLVYCDVLEDREGQVLMLRANTRNSTNPNGASVYHLNSAAAVSKFRQFIEDGKGLPKAER